MKNAVKSLVVVAGLFTAMTMWAQERDFTHFATTLTVSPYQNQLLIEQIAQEICDRYGMMYAGADFSGHYPQATRRARAAGMYRQNYCGCAPSKSEAKLQRARRSAR